MLIEQQRFHHNASLQRGASPEWFMSESVSAIILERSEQRVYRGIAVAADLVACGAESCRVTDITNQIIPE